MALVESKPAISQSSSVAPTTLSLHAHCFDPVSLRDGGRVQGSIFLVEVYLLLADVFVLTFGEEEVTIFIYLAIAVIAGQITAGQSRPHKFSTGLSGMVSQRLSLGMLGLAGDQFRLAVLPHAAQHPRALVLQDKKNSPKFP